MLIVEEWILRPKQERQEHLRLDEPCLKRGGESYQHRGVLAQYLDTTIPKTRMINLCHACNDGECSNPRHLYWGTPTENSEDAITSGARPSRKGLPGHPQSEETSRCISETMKGRPSNNPTGIGGGKPTPGYRRSYPQIWITDGSESTRIPLGQDIPKGWIRGRTIKLFGPPSKVTVFVS